VTRLVLYNEDSTDWRDRLAMTWWAALARRALAAGLAAAALPGAGGARGSLPAVHVVSPLNAGLYSEAGAVPVVVQVTGVDKVAHGEHEVLVRLELENAGWEDTTSWPLREAKAWSEPAASAQAGAPLEFRIVLVDIPRGRHTMEVSLRPIPPPAKRARRQSDPPQPSFTTSTQTPFIVRAIPALEPRPDWNTTVCTLLVDTSKVGGIHKQQLLVGFVEGAGAAPAKFEDMETRQCLIYRVQDVSTPAPQHDARYNLQHGSALLTGIGPVDGDGTGIFSRYSEEIDIPVLVNRLCFARRESMDLLFLAGTLSTQHGQSPLALKATGVLAALREYAGVVWVDMDGVMPLMPRPETRTCVPFTTCWPPAAQVILPRVPIYPFNPSPALMIFRRSAQSSSFLSSTLHSPARLSTSEHVVLADAVLSTLHQDARLVYVGQCSRPGATVACWADAVDPPSKSRSSSAKTRYSDRVWNSNSTLRQDWNEPHRGVLLGKEWCQVEPDANLALICPCSAPSPPIAGGQAAAGLAAMPGWCGQDLDGAISASPMVSAETDTAARPDHRDSGRRAHSKQGQGQNTACHISRCRDVEVLLVNFGPGSHFMARGPEVSHP